MVIDMFYDSVCRCFLGPESQNPSSPTSAETKVLLQNNRTQRVHLKGKQFDNLFSNINNNINQETKNNKNDQGMKSTEAPSTKSNQYSDRSKRKSKKKRRSPASRRDEIFRSRKSETRDQPASSVPTNSGRFSSVAQVLCFATPIHDGEEENSILRSESDCNTLNTCEDTITSTLFFEKKYEHIVESRPPMPLFNQFKVDDKNELRRIVATDSHNSLKMIRLMRETPKKKTPMDDSDDDQVPPAVKIDSSESSNEQRR
eukprot:CAMPEP_0194130440 /NCGR_PEP_ID=MMETSP0152-20130528/1476_1 /TAXON_ID=1049557 /ORGANISM="Thalassiothrix antarctica, Strain L6-D1" /LENGTH=257 /DNA_ID=CAMNT_0038824953 /DNA_START=460 /DNA_END=1233 /DNA_ORIENTATION=-